MIVLLLGAPGCGKGSQAKKIEAAFGYLHTSTGDMLREAIRKGTELGKRAKSAMESGQLVADEIVVSLIEERIEALEGRSGLILDGFPRNVAQADELNKMLAKHTLKLDKVFYFEVPQEKIKARLLARRVCSVCQKDFNMLTNPPKNSKCDACSGEVITRADDNEETITNRLEVYEKSTQPLLDYYEKSGSLARLDGDKEIEVVFQQISLYLTGEK